MLADSIALNQMHVVGMQKPSKDAVRCQSSGGVGDKKKFGDREVNENDE